MYEAFYKLSGQPFRLNPDPRFFFRSTGHKRAQAYMRYGLQQEQGFIVVTGDVGTGKTMLVNNLFKELDDTKYVAAKIVSTNVKDVDLLRLIASEFEIPFERSSKAALLTRLGTYFKSSREEGKRVLLVVDEAQNLPRSALEELRMLSNFDYDGNPLVQSFLLGQREFRSMLRAPGLEQLRQRVIAAYHLKPLSVNEIKSYVEHRLRTVGWESDPVITDEVYDRIYEATGGVPRRINTMFDRVLLNGYLDERHEINGECVKEILDEIENEQSEIDENPPAGLVSTVTSKAAAGSSESPVATGDQGDSVAAQLLQMQRTIDALSKKLQERGDHVGPGGAIFNNEHREDGGARFPIWTIAFVLTVAVIVTVGGVFGYLILS